MFASLAAFANTSNQSDGFQNIGEYISNQQKLFETIPYLLPASTSGLNGFDTAMKTVETHNNSYQKSNIKHPNDIFMPTVSTKLQALAKQCSTGSIDDLIRIKNDEEVGCGWMYTPPNKNSAIPLLSQGAVGTQQGPTKAFDYPEYRQWFFDLQLAKRQMLLDKCKALKGCTDVDSNVFSGCGYCTDTNQGVPIDSVGRPLYADDPRGNCNVESIVRSSDKCPPPPTPGSGPQPIVDRTCDPVNGRLSSLCLYNQVLQGGCSDSGALAVALLTSHDANNYVGNLPNSDAVKVYNRVVNPPLNIDIFRDGRTTASNALYEVRNLVGNVTKPATSAIGAAARDLCLRQGSISNYDLCTELSDASQAPFDVKCLQQIFVKMGGQPAGKAYPNASNMAQYNAMGTIGAFKQYIADLVSKMNIVDQFVDYKTQQDALHQMLGIKTDRLIARAPYVQGVEVFWFKTGSSGLVDAFLRRTIETDIAQFNLAPSVVPQIGGAGGATAIQLFDYRASTDFDTKFNVKVDDAFWIAVNQPVDIEEEVFSYTNIDRPGLFATRLFTELQSVQCSHYNKSTPNITKMYWGDGGGYQAFLVRPIGCTGGDTPFNKNMMSLTCEERAPFLRFEVGAKGKFEEVRNPFIFQELVGQNGLDAHTRTDEQLAVPGKKSFVRMGYDSRIHFTNIAFQSWNTVTIATRFRTMPVKEQLVTMGMGPLNDWASYSLIVYPINGSMATIKIETGGRLGNKIKDTDIWIKLNEWYIFIIQQSSSGFNLQVYNISDIYNGVSQNTGINSYGQRLYNDNGIWVQNVPGYNYEYCNFYIGLKNGMTPAFSYDVAWTHFFDYKTQADDIKRECNCDWIYTDFPKEYNKY